MISPEDDNNNAHVCVIYLPLVWHLYIKRRGWLLFIQVKGIAKARR
nr:MAG TPA: hypothetical protein [Caudoviricetes sp.]